MKNLKKATYSTPEIEFLSIRTDEDILSTSPITPEGGSGDNDYGIMFPY